MHFEPTAQEAIELVDMSAQQRLMYFLTRTLEVEEIWGVADVDGWVMHDENNLTVLPLWPYRQLADKYIKETDMIPQSVSLEHFVYSLLGRLVDMDVMVEIMPNHDSRGSRLPAQELSQLYTSLLEAGDYFIEG